MNRLLSSTITVISLLLFMNQAMGQCTLDAGDDTSVCVNLGVFEFTLGESLTISNGTPPYAYSWSCQYTTGPLEYTASDFLNDTTAATPELTDWVEDSLVFHISVTDADGNTCSDSLMVFFCTYGITLEDKQVTIVQGDTAQLYPGVFGNCEPVTYQWTPNYNISDPTIVNPEVWPDTTTFYVATAIDAAGCEITDETFEVYVTPLSTNNPTGQTGIRIFPNPMTDFAEVEIWGYRATNLRIELYDVQGRMVSGTSFSGNRTEIKRNNLQSGLYIYRLFENNQPLGHGKLIID